MTPEPLDLPPLSHYRRQIEAALGHCHVSDLYTFDDVARLVAEGQFQYWPTPGAVVLTELIDYPRARVCNYFLAAGTLAELERVAPVIEQWARRQGCTRLQAAGRRGWSRTFMTRTGWTPVPCDVLTKDLTGGTHNTHSA